MRSAESRKQLQFERQQQQQLVLLLQQQQQQQQQHQHTSNTHASSNNGKLLSHQNRECRKKQGILKQKTAKKRTTIDCLSFGPFQTVCML